MLSSVHLTNRLFLFVGKINIISWYGTLDPRVSLVRDGSDTFAQRWARDYTTSGRRRLQDTQVQAVISTDKTQWNDVAGTCCLLRICMYVCILYVLVHSKLNCITVCLAGPVAMALALLTDLKLNIYILLKTRFALSLSLVT